MTLTYMHDEAPSIAEAPPLFDIRNLERAGLRMTQRRYEAGNAIFLRGDTADRLYLLVEGVVRICKTYGGYSQATIALLKDNGGFGEFDLFGKDQQSASAEAVTDCRVASVRKSDLRYAMEQRPGFAMELFPLFCEKLRHSEQAMEVLFHREIATRLLELLPMLAERFADLDGTGAEPVIPLSHLELAEMVASSREAVSKALGQLQSEGLIELGKRKIKIKDYHSFEERARNHQRETRRATRRERV